MSDIAENLSRVKIAITAAADRSGRSADDVELVAVTKTWPPEVIREAISAGHTVLGENRIQEALAKIPLLPDRLEWHLIGHLQKNKIRKALPHFDTIHSIDSLELARQVDRIAAELGRFPTVYLETNIAGEASKHGFSPDQLRADLDELLDLARLQIVGLMAIPPFSPDPEETRPHFAGLRDLRDSLEQQTGIPLPKLSMGMSNDFPIAIEEGATIVRVGSAIFGPRKNTLTPKPDGNPA